MPIPITFTQNEVVAGGKGKGKGKGKKKDATKEEEEEVLAKDDPELPIFKALPDVKRASVVQGLANIAKDSEKKKKAMGKEFEAKAPADAVVLKEKKEIEKCVQSIKELIKKGANYDFPQKY